MLPRTIAEEFWKNIFFLFFPGIISSNLFFRDHPSRESYLTFSLLSILCRRRRRRRRRIEQICLREREREHLRAVSATLLLYTFAKVLGSLYIETYLTSSLVSTLRRRRRRAEQINQREST